MAHVAAEVATLLATAQSTQITHFEYGHYAQLSLAKTTMQIRNADPSALLVS
jgi:hypothetical protein